MKPRARAAMIWASALAIATLACSDEARPRDAGVSLDGAEPADAMDDSQPAVLAVDFTVSGCASYDVSKAQCRGKAPLTLSFVPIASGQIKHFRWSFGDSYETSDTTPVHTYTLPGRYSVQLIGTPGLPFQQHDDFVVVEPNDLGSSCDVDSQCDSASALACTCGSACPAAFARGICSRACKDAPCPAGAACADLSLGAAANSPDPWRKRLCLRACSADEQCPLGQRCRAVPAADKPGQWTRACFVAFPGDLGASCRGTNGELQNELCLSGRCVDLGALGMCSADCSSQACPAGTACATFGDGRRLCLPACESANACNDDPLLGCMASGGGGPLGFSVADAPAGAAYCAPRPCIGDSACAPSGVCTLEPEGHCTRRPPAPR